MRRFDCAASRPRRAANVSSSPDFDTSGLYSLRANRQGANDDRCRDDCERSLAISVLGWPCDRVDDEILERSLARFEYQPELLAQDGKCVSVLGRQVGAG